MKGFIAVFSLVFFLWGHQGWAAPAYGPRMPARNQLFWGGQTYSVQNRDLEGENGSLSSLQHFMLLSYGITDWLSLDLKGGAGDAHHHPQAGSQVSYPAYMAGGYGFRVKLAHGETTDVVFGFQHISVHPYSVFVDTVKKKAVIDDWQLSLLASKDFKVVEPYVGIKWSRMDYIFWNEDDRNRVKSDLTKSVGPFAGMNVPLTKKVWLNFEAQFVDATALAGSINFHF